MQASFQLPDPNVLDIIRRQYGLSLILLHGSHVRGMVHPKSDVDIAVFRQKRAGTLQLLELIRHLSQVFETANIDVVDLTYADPLLLFAVVGHSRLLSGNQAEFDTLQRTAFHRYNDYLPFLKQEREFVEHKLQTYVTA